MPALPLGFVMIQTGEGIIKTSETCLSSLPVSPHPICLAWQCRDRLPAHVLRDEMAPLRPLSTGNGNWSEISLYVFWAGNRLFLNGAIKKMKQTWENKMPRW